VLLADAIPQLSVKQASYQTIFREMTGLDALCFERSLYRDYANSVGAVEADSLCQNDHALWLDFIFSHRVQNAMPREVIFLVYGYPAIQSSLARINPQDPRISERFEVFINGTELGNGFFELNDANEQAARFDREIAIGLDRLLMIVTGCTSIEQVIAFPTCIA
jgi:lysyl-tRNA synthetase class 2